MSDERLTMISSKKYQKEQSEILYAQSPVLLIVTLLIMLLVVSHYWAGENHSSLLIWAGVVTLLTTARIWLIWNFKLNRESKPPEHWLNIFALSSLVSGTLWGGGLLYTLLPSLNGDVVVLVITLSGMTAGSLVPLSTYLLNYYLFAVPALLPFSVYLLNQPEAELFLIGILVLIFLLSMMIFSFLVNRNVIETIRLRFANVDLLESLKVQKNLAEKVNLDKSRFLAATSHDLRQPLHALDLYLGGLKVQLSEPKNLELVNKARLSSQALGELLNALMDVSKLDSGAVPVDAKPFSLMALITSIYNDYGESAKERGINFESQLEDVIVHTDPVLLGRILRNLISNAIYHNSDCALSISTQINNNSISIKIKDKGQGIDAAELNNIFSEFYQLNNPERDRTKGLGLGLAIVKRLSTLLDIPIDVSSELGKGTEFSLTLAIELDKTVVLEEKSNIDTTDLTGLFIIIIDDESTVRDAMKLLLRAWGCEVLLASSQIELITQLTQDNYPAPDIIISDYRLKDNKTGIEAVETIRNYFKMKLPALIVTGDSSSFIVDEVVAKRCGLLLKPVDSDILHAKITDLIH